MIIKNWKDLEDYVAQRVHRATKPEIINSIVDAIDFDPNRPSFGDNWRGYLDTLPPNIIVLNNSY